MSLLLMGAVAEEPPQKEARKPEPAKEDPARKDAPKENIVTSRHSASLNWAGHATLDETAGLHRAQRLSASLNWAESHRCYRQPEFLVLNAIRRH